MRKNEKKFTQNPYMIIFAFLTNSRTGSLCSNRAESTGWPSHSRGPAASTHHCTEEHKIKSSTLINACKIFSQAGFIVLVRTELSK